MSHIEDVQSNTAKQTLEEFPPARRLWSPRRRIATLGVMRWFEPVVGSLFEYESVATLLAFGALLFDLLVVLSFSGIEPDQWHSGWLCCFTR
jgi:hypothetical protein